MTSLLQSAGVLSPDPGTVDFTRHTSTEIAILPVPEVGDSLEDVAIKMNSLKKVVDSGKSVAVATNYRGMAYGELDPEAIARKAMNPTELDAYDAWAAGRIRLPVMDWETMKEDAFCGKKTAKRNKARLEGVRIVFNNPEASDEHLAYITKHMEYDLLPLVKAVARVENVKKDLRGGQDVLNAEEWAELQCLNQVQSTAHHIVNQRMEEANKSMRLIKTATGIIQAREETMRLSLEAQGLL